MIVKTGISGQKLNADGSSPRANVQVNALNYIVNRSFRKVKCKNHVMTAKCGMSGRDLSAIMNCFPK